MKKVKIDVLCGQNIALSIPKITFVHFFPKVANTLSVIVRLSMDSTRFQLHGARRPEAHSFTASQSSIHYLPFFDHMLLFQNRSSFSLFDPVSPPVFTQKTAGSGRTCVPKARPGSGSDFLRADRPTDVPPLRLPKKQKKEQSGPGAEDHSG